VKGFGFQKKRINKTNKMRGFKCKQAKKRQGNALGGVGCGRKFQKTMHYNSYGGCVWVTSPNNQNPLKSLVTKKVGGKGCG
jgi:hypothetical protein